MARCYSAQFHVAVAQHIDTASNFALAAFDFDTCRGLEIVVHAAGRADGHTGRRQRAVLGDQRIPVRDPIDAMTGDSVTVDDEEAFVD